MDIELTRVDKAINTVYQIHEAEAAIFRAMEASVLNLDTFKALRKALETLNATRNSIYDALLHDLSPVETNKTEGING